jgi:hypothetical protein
MAQKKKMNRWLKFLIIFVICYIVCFIPFAVFEWNTRCIPQSPNGDILTSPFIDHLSCATFNAGILDLLSPLFLIWTLWQTLSTNQDSSGEGSFAFGIGFFGIAFFSLPFFLVFVGLIVLVYKLLPYVQKRFLRAKK